MRKHRNGPLLINRQMKMESLYACTGSLFIDTDEEKCYTIFRKVSKYLRR